MKNLIVLSSSLPDHCEKFQGNFVFDLSAAISEKGVNVVILCPHNYKAKFFENAKGILVYRFPYFIPFSFQKLADGTGIAKNIQTSILSVIQIPLLLLSEIFFTFILVLKNQIDYVHSHWIVPQGFVGAIISFVLKKPHICTIHAADIFLLRKLFFHKYLLKFIIRNTNHFFIVSNYVFNAVNNQLSSKDSEILSKKYSILPMGVHVSRFELDKKIIPIRKKYCVENKFILLFIGRLTDKKGVEYLIESLYEVIQYDANIHLLICGNGPLHEILLDKADNLVLNNFVSFLGYITEKEKIELLSIADVLVVPSIVLDNGETEGMPVVVLEGMAAGLPIIASDVSGVRDVIQTNFNGLLVQARNSHQIAMAILMLMKDPVLREKLGNEAKKSSKMYDWENISQSYLSQLNGMKK